MPSSKNYVRDYKQERRTAKKRGEVSTGSDGENASRKRARRMLEKAKGKAALKGKDVAHKNNNPKDNRRSNLAIQSKSKNRSVKRK